MGGAPEVMKAFSGVAQAALKAGSLDTKTKELIALAIRVAVRCDDCIAYHVAQCRDAGVDRDQMFEAFSVALVVGGSIVIPHLRRAVDFLDRLEGGVDAPQAPAHDH